MSNKNHSYKTPYRRSTSLDLNIRQFQSGRYSVSKNVPFDAGHYHDVLQHLREFALAHPNVIRSYQVVVYGWANDLDREMSATVQNLTMPSNRQNDFDRFTSMKENLDKSFSSDLGGSSHDFYIRFMRIIVVAWKNWKQKYDAEKKIRAEKQRIGKAEADRERKLKMKEKEQSRIRHEREKNKKLRELGMLAPAKKKSHHNAKRTWI